MMNDAAIEIRGLQVTRGHRRVIDGLDLTVPTGQVVGLLGPSGSGKTTLMRSIVGVQQVDAGAITVLGLAAGHRDLRSQVGYVTQAPSVYEDLTIAENLEYFRRVLGAPASDVARVIDEAGLNSHHDQLVSRLSGGQHSRVSLAAALLGSPRLLVLDEPTVGLDPVLRRDLWDLFARIAARGATLLVSSHVMDEATRCDRLVLMRDGAVLADDTHDSLLHRTGAADVEAAFLSLVEGVRA
ncbi:MAG TPA: ABC transporter ATP-binding protein [Angustibacter sp.]|nr:ABC transporter ATP-binding protein [Angustibacter sp.]